MNILLVSTMEDQKGPKIIMKVVIGLLKVGSCDLLCVGCDNLDS